VKVPYAWLREYVDVEVAPEKLGEALTLVGLAVEGLEGQGDAAVLDLDVTTNRVDCMNVYGVAREVAVFYGLPLKPLALDCVERGRPAEEALDVVIEASDLCKHFCARVLDVRLGPSPEWLRQRLEAVGVRPISNLVDLTNYVMMEMGQPTHAFDLAKIPAGRLHVRWARAGERVTTLDGVERTLSGTVPVGVVAGPEAPLALAGIMGGASSEVSAGTRVVALEAAAWEPRAIRRGSRFLGMHTEASHRFERGADPEGPPLAMNRLAHLLEKTGAGTCRPGLIERHPVPAARTRVVLRAARLEALLGTGVASARVGAILEGLGFSVGPWASNQAEIAVPTWRGDVSREVDLVEEVGRHHGLGRIEARLPPAAEPQGLTETQRRGRLIRDTLCAAGFTEVINYAFGPVVDPGLDLGPAVVLANPLAEDQTGLRRSLLPGLLANLGTNLRQGRKDVAIFEMGRVFRPGEGLPVEERRLGLLLAGEGRPGHWSERGRPADVFDVKGLLELLFRRLGLGPADLASGDGLPSYLHPGRSAVVRLNGGGVAGSYGALHPDTRAAYDLRDDVLIAELRLEALQDRSAPPVRMEPLDRFPAVSRDLSILADAQQSSARLMAHIRQAAGPSLRGVALVDRYDRPPVPPGKVSLTVSLRFQDRTRTLTGEEVQAAVESVVRALRAAGAEIRGE
jgi:phenylalanyl-tRNA synthetase beta chain